MCLFRSNTNIYNKYLGVILDSKLKWDLHVEMLKSRLRKLIFVFHRLYNILTFNEIRQVYFAQVQSILQHGILVWGNAYQNIIEPLTVVQKSIIKAALKKNRRFPMTLLYKESGLLSVKQLYLKTILVYTFSHGDQVLAPIEHNYHTRNAARGGLRIPRVVKSINFTNAIYVANLLFRRIPPEIRRPQVATATYKKRVTAWLLEIGPERSAALLSAPN
jgi:hypothetical protein